MSEKRQFNSTQLLEGEYFPETKKLHITFRQGRNKYEYDNVGPEVWQGLCEAGSSGSFFHQNIKKGPYPYRKLVPPQPEPQATT